MPQDLREVFEVAGLRGLYSGISAPLLSEVPRRALKFTMNGIFKQRLSILCPEPRTAFGNAAHCSTGPQQAWRTNLVLCLSKQLIPRVKAALTSCAADPWRGQHSGFGAGIPRTPTALDGVCNDEVVTHPEMVM